MQRALRVNPKEQQLWLQYFNLEMHYVQRMRGRREILQLEGVASKSMTENALFSGGIASIVYKNAVKAVDEREEDGPHAHSTSEHRPSDPNRRRTRVSEVSSK